MGRATNHTWKQVISMQMFSIIFVSYFLILTAVADNLLRSEPDDHSPPKLHSESIKLDTELRNIISHLEEGATRIGINQNHESVTLVLGNVGTGKTFFTKFMAEDNSQLVSREIVKGTKDFLIWDIGHEINTKLPMASETLFPKLVTDSDFNVTYYDCPGFEDVRMKNDIATTYFIKSIIRQSRSLKLVLVIGFSSVKKMGNLKEFVTLLKHMSNILLNVADYKKSILLVVSKVSNFYHNRKLVSDDVMLKNIENVFETDVKPFLTGNINSRSSRQGMLQLLDVFIQKDNGNYTNMILIRKPTEAGRLHEILSLKNQKVLINNVLNKKLKFTTIKNGDFGYTVSEPSQIYVTNLAKNIVLNIAKDFSEIGNDLLNYYTDFELIAKNTEFIINTFEKLYNAFSETVKLALELSKPQELIKILLKIFEVFDLNISGRRVLNILIQAKYSFFFQEISNSNVQYDSQQWLTGLKNVNQYLKNTIDVYKFYNKLYEVLSEYHIQSNLKNYTKNLNLHELNLNHTKSMAESSQHNFLMDVIKTEYVSVKNIELNAPKVLVLKQILHLLLIQEPQYSCLTKPNEVVVRAINYKLSHLNLTETYSGCEKNIQIYHILAAHKIFIDSGLRRMNKPPVISIVAPIWEVKGYFTINLNGAHASPLKKTVAQNGLFEGQSGKDGIPGNPGYPAGHFYGIGESFYNIDKLTIYANGGDGTKGQDGGNGMDGRTSKNYETKYFDPETLIKGLYGQGATNNDFTLFFNYTIWEKIHCYEFMVEGLKGQKGGNGGNGGKGGHAGQKGIVSIWSLSEEIRPKIVNNNGKPGNGGTGGKRGSGGMGGTKIKLLCCSRIVCKVLKPLFTRTKAYDGISGKDSYVSTRIKSAPAQVQIDRSFSINSFKYHARDLLSETKQQNKLIDFLTKLDKYSKVISSYTPLSLFNELQGMEDQFYKLQYKLDILPFYKQFLDRVGIFADTKVKSDEDKKVIGEIYTATLGKITCINNSVTDDLLIDVKGYLDLLAASIDRLKDIANIDAVNEQEKEYKAVIDKKNAECKELIDETISKEIDNTLKELEVRFAELVNATIDRKDEMAEQAEEQRKAQKEARKAAFLGKIFFGLKIVSALLVFIQSVGPIISAVAITAISIAKPLAIKNAPPLGALGGPVTKMAKSISTLKSESFTKRYDLLKSQLDASSRLSKRSNVKPLEKFFFNMQSDLKKIPTSANDFKIKNIMLEEFENKIKDKIRTISDEYLSEYFKKIYELKDVSVPAFEAVSSDLGKLKKFVKLSKKQSAEMTRANNFQNGLMKIATSFSTKIVKSFEELKTLGQNGSSPKFDMKNWDIKNTLREVKFKILNIDQICPNIYLGDVINTFEKLDSALEASTKMYNRIENYNSQAEFASYVAAISSKNALGIKVADKELKYAVEKLNVIIKSNIILGKYNRAMKAFQLYVFPFANLYLDQFKLPTNLKLDNSTDNLIFAAIKQIEKLREELGESYLSIDKYDKYIHTNIQFDSSKEYSSPFYIWKNDECIKDISNLLNGNKIILSSDIMKGIQKNAVKFNEIGVYFKSRNKTLQGEINKVFENFKINITHLGFNHYKCGNKYFLITSDRQYIQYSFKKNKFDKPLITNLLYDNIKSGNVILSPYTIWSLQLISLENNNFQQLNKYKQFINIELIGVGQYIDQGTFDSEICSQNLNDYYTEDERLSNTEPLNLNHVSIYKDLNNLELNDNLNQID